MKNLFRVSGMLTLLALMLSMLMVSTVSADDVEHKVFVCKYVGTPFVDESLQEGGNPISVDVHAIPIYDKEDPAFDTPEELVGEEFADEQGQSIVIAVDVGQEEPNVDECPAPREPRPVAPAVLVTAPTCTADGTITVTAIEGVTYNVPAFTFGVAFDVTTTLDEGYVLAEGATGSFRVTVQAKLTGEVCAAAATAAAASATPPSCTAAGRLLVPADTASVMYTVSPAYTAGATGTFTVTATAKAGFVLAGTSQWVLNVGPQVTGAACVTGSGTLPGNPVRTGTLGGVPNTAMDAPMNDGMPTTLITVLALAGLAYVGHRNLIAMRARS